MFPAEADPSWLSPCFARAPQIHLFQLGTARMASSSPSRRTMWPETTLRIAAAYVALASVGFGIWKTTGDDAGYQLVGLLVGFVVAAIILLAGAIVQFCHRKFEVGLAALI